MSDVFGCFGDRRHHRPRKRCCGACRAVYEAILGLARIRNTSIQDAQIVLDRFLEAAQAQIIPITAEIGRGALSAFDRFGKARHAADLNMGDCFACACARELDLPILFKGEDFPLTDIAIA